MSDMERRKTRMTEFTMTFDAELTCIFRDKEDSLEYVCSDEFKGVLRSAVLHAFDAIHDVSIDNVKVFISKEDFDEEGN